MQVQLCSLARRMGLGGCVDYRELNKQIVNDKFPIPLVETYWMNYVARLSFPILT